MGQPYIVIGDKTSHGGTVVEGSATSTINGKKVACVGHKVSCPVPGHGTNPIVVGDPDWTIDGQMVARQGDTSACGATLIATQTQTSDE